MTKDKSRLGLITAMAMSISNHFSNGFDKYDDRPISTVSYAKSQLTNKQKKARAKSKQAKIARRRNR